MNLVDFVKRADELIAQADAELKSKRRRKVGGGAFVDGGGFAGFRAESLSFLKNNFGPEHPFYAEFNKRVENANDYAVSRGIGILKAVRGEIEGGWTQTA